MAPAIRLARDGFILTCADTDILDTTVKRFRQDPESARIFLRKDGEALQPGDRLVQADLADTLSAISEKGPDAFYQGKIPQAVEAAAKKGGGILTAADFADYKITETAPITCSYRGYKFVSAPPPSSGGVTLCETLNVLEGYNLKSMGFNSADYIHTLTEAMRHAYMDRNTFLGDPEFVKNPLDRLLSKSYAADIRKQIVANKATPSVEVQPGMQPHENRRRHTTPSSIMRVMPFLPRIPLMGALARWSLLLVLASSSIMKWMILQLKWVNKICMDWYKVQPTLSPPGKRPLSSMSPTLVTKDGKTFMVLGSPGGSRIISITLQTALNVIDHGMAPQEAVDAPRIHHQWLPDEVYYEQRGVSADSLNILKSMGYKMVEQSPWGAAELILVGLAGVEGVSPANSGNDSAVSGKVREGYLYGANDVRRPAGAAIGY